MFIVAIMFIVLYILLHLLSLYFGDSKKQKNIKKQERTDKAEKARKIEKNRELELEKYAENISQFNISEIGRPYKALSFVESSHRVQNTSRQLICEQAHKLGANAIVNMQLQTEVKTSGGGESYTTTQEDIFNTSSSTSKTKSKSIKSHTMYIYTGTAIILKD
ncbi:MAG: hypothetical protein PHS42_08380 [Sulfurimonas sp.]|nr:hypothetical protein [Sulfurimonas sp.]MDD3835477.1 hypothetical protein [Sulfurimonas sp.]